MFYGLGLWSIEASTVLRLGPQFLVQVLFAEVQIHETIYDSWKLLRAVDGDSTSQTSAKFEVFQGAFWTDLSYNILVVLQ